MSKREQTSCSSSANECPAGIYAEGTLAACARFNKKCRLVRHFLLNRVSHGNSNPGSSRRRKGPIKRQRIWELQSFWMRHEFKHRRLAVF